MTTISLEMVLPGLIGLWIDRQLGTVMVFLVLGLVLGMTTGMLHLIRIAAAAGQPHPSHKKPADEEPEESKRTEDQGT